MKTRGFTPDTIKKIETFLEQFKKDPTQPVLALCREMSISKTVLYNYLRLNNLSLDKLRNAPEMKKVQNKKPTQTKIERLAHNSPLTPDQMKAIVDEIDEIKKQHGISLQEATQKSSSGIHFSTYYNYRRQIANKDNKLQTKNKKTKRKYTRRNNDEMPTFPHTIVYNEKAEKPSKKGGIEDLDMMIDHVELLLRYMKKARG